MSRSFVGVNSNSSMGSVLHIQSFLAGISATVCVALILSRRRNDDTTLPIATAGDLEEEKEVTQPKVKYLNGESENGAQSAIPKQGTEREPPQLMDSATLDQRMIRKAEGAILNRTSRLIIVVERCTNDHNYSAILRTAEALGVQNVWIIAPQKVQSSLEVEEDDVVAEAIQKTALKSSSGLVFQATGAEKKDRAMHHLFAKKATEWLTVREFDDTKSCIDELRRDGRKIWVTDLSQEASCLTKEDLQAYWQTKEQSARPATILPSKLAIVFGTEAVGATTEMLNAADLRVYFRLGGFADSLNLSVATALVVHQLFVLDPTLVGAMSERERKSLRLRWYAKLASQRLLSKKQKKDKTKLVTYIIGCEEIGRKIESGAEVHDEEREKWSKLESKRAELNSINNKLARESEKAVADLVENPPAPITDMRRADEHRTCFVGRNTKKMNGEIWADMPATNKFVVEKPTTAAFFRDLVKTIS